MAALVLLGTATASIHGARQPPFTMDSDVDAEALRFLNLLDALDPSKADVESLVGGKQTVHCSSPPNIPPVLTMPTRALCLTKPTPRPSNTRTHR
jgi:hypothetical protein